MGWHRGEDRLSSRSSPPCNFYFHFPQKPSYFSQLPIPLQNPFCCCHMFYSFQTPLPGFPSLLNTLLSSTCCFTHTPTHPSINTDAYATSPLSLLPLTLVSMLQTPVSGRVCRNVNKLSSEPYYENSSLTPAKRPSHLPFFSPSSLFRTSDKQERTGTSPPGVQLSIHPLLLGPDI